MMYLRSSPAVLILLGILAATAACESGTTPPPFGNGGNGENGGGGGETFEVIATNDLRFIQEALLIPQGSMVRWVSQSIVPHSVTPTDHDEWEAAHREGMGVILEHVFTEPGIYEYRCEFWPEMTGSIEVISLN